ncbi:hypothetical protein ACET3Z_015874 [Daucus carota]
MVLEQAPALKKLVSSIFQIGSVGYHEVNRCKEIQFFWGQSPWLDKIRGTMCMKKLESHSRYWKAVPSAKYCLGLLTRYLCYKGTKSVTGNC